jgi:hypothetical protein
MRQHQRLKGVNDQMNSNTAQQAQKSAQSKIENGWRDVADRYTVGWGGPLEAVEMQFPHVSAPVSDIRRKIAELAFIIYQTRESPPQSTIIAVPYADGGDPYKCRLVTTDQLSVPERTLLAEFAQAIWFLIETEFLPDPRDGRSFERKLIELTDAKLISL